MAFLPRASVSRPRAEGKGEEILPGPGEPGAPLFPSEAWPRFQVEHQT